MKRLLSLSAVGAVVVIAYLNARAVSFLVDATLTTAASPVARYEAPTTQESKAKSAAPILERNPFDHASRLVPQPVNDAPRPPSPYSESSHPASAALRPRCSVR